MIKGEACPNPCQHCTVKPAVYICNSCQRELHPNEHGLYDNIAFVEFGGGYGCFVDPEFGERLVAHLCHECAHIFTDNNPWAAKLIDPDRSHICP